MAADAIGTAADTGAVSQAAIGAGVVGTTGMADATVDTGALGATGTDGIACATGDTARMPAAGGASGERQL